MRKAKLFICLLAASACGGRPLPKGSTDGGGGSGNNGCAPGELDLSVYGSTVSNSCYQATVFKGSSVIVQFAPIDSQSVWGSDGDGVQILFSSDPSCVYGDGKVFQLGDPCLSITDNSQPGGGALPGCTLADGGTFDQSTGPCPEEFFGVANSCTTQPASGGTAGCGPLDQTGTAPTSGTLTIEHWSTTVGDTIQLTLSGAITGFVMTLTSANPIAVTHQSIPLAVSGTASAVVQQGL